MSKLLRIGEGIVNLENVLWIKKGLDPRTIEVRYINDTDLHYFKDEYERNLIFEKIITDGY